MPRPTTVQITACADELHAMDLDRATQLETIAAKYGCEAQVQTEVNGLRAADRKESRRLQLNQAMKLVAVPDTDGPV